MCNEVGGRSREKRKYWTLSEQGVLVGEDEEGEG